MKIAVAGCLHGQLEIVYDTLQFLETENNVKIDLLLCCGDFQATRNQDDLNCMAAPPKYRDMCTFHKYYSGEKLAPIPTIFIGGNHEASNYLQELPYGGWVAPNIYYLGYVGVINFGGIRIAGLSGIFKGIDYCKGRYEKPPYNEDTLRSCYHFRNLDIFRLKQLSKPVHIMLTHDWPNGIYNHGNLQKLLKVKPYFREDIQKDILGNKPTAELLTHLKPDYWFSAHLHVRFPAIVVHKDESIRKITKFLALDKCLPQRGFLQVIDLPHDMNAKLQLMYDLEWLTILHTTNRLLSVKKVNCYLPSSESEERYNFTPTPEEIEIVRNKFGNKLEIPRNFVATAPSYNPNAAQESKRKVLPQINPQTVKFCEKLDIDDPIRLLLERDECNTSNTSLSGSLDSSSFLLPTDSECDVSSNSPFFRRNTLKTPMRLPKPLNTSDLPDETCLTSTPYRGKEVISDVVRESNSPAEGTSTAEEFSDDSRFNASQKFKRRNFSIYAPEDEE